MQGFVLVDEFQNTANEFLPAKIAEFPKGGSPAEVLRAIRVATGTAERAFSRDLNRQKGGIPAQNTPPSRQYLSGCETSFWRRSHRIYI